MEHTASIALNCAALLGVGAFCQWLAWRMRLPAILPLLLAGLLLGPALGVLKPDEFLGELLFPFVSLGVAVILFEGSLTLRFSDVRSVSRIIRNLTTVGVLVTAFVMAWAANYLLDLDWPLALLFGALVSVTGPTVVMPMLRSIRPTSRIASILRWEGILVDPIGAVLAVLVFEFILTGAQSRSLLEFLKVIALGTVWGISGGVALAQVLRHHLLPDFLMNYVALAAVLLVFTVSNALGDESGLVAVTVMGLVLANSRGVDVEELLSFKEHLTLVLISVLFILLAARLDVTPFLAIWKPALLVLLVALFMARPLSVLASSVGTSINWREGLLLAWVAPRGIVAASVSALFAIRLEAHGDPQAGLLVPLCFMIIIGTVVIQSLTAGALASRLGLSSRGEQGVLVVGANPVALALAEAFKDEGLRVMVADTDREGLQQARMGGIATYYGNPLSDHAERHMDLSGYTHLMAMSRNPESNAVVCKQLRHEFGQRRVFAVQANSGEEDDREGLSRRLRANTLFPRDTTWAKLASLLAQGAQAHATTLSENFDHEAYKAQWGSLAIPLFALDAKGRLVMRTVEAPWSPEPGWKVVALVPAEPNGRNNGAGADASGNDDQKP